MSLGASTSLGGASRDPIVRIRELERDRVNFVLENVDLSCVLPSVFVREVLKAFQVCKLPAEGGYGRHPDRWCVRKSCSATPILISLILEAVDEVEMIENTSVLPDEFIAHRIGMVPLKSMNCDESIRYVRVRASQLVTAILSLVPCLLRNAPATSSANSAPSSSHSTPDAKQLRRWM